MDSDERTQRPEKAPRRSVEKSARSRAKAAAGGGGKTASTGRATTAKSTKTAASGAGKKPGSAKRGEARVSPKRATGVERAAQGRAPAKTGEEAKVAPRRPRTEGAKASDRGAKTKVVEVSEPSRKKRPPTARAKEGKETPVRTERAKVAARRKQEELEKPGQGTPGEARPGATPSGHLMSEPAVEGRKRVVIEKVWPEIDGGLHPAKRVAGERMTVEAAIFADGHESLSGRLLHRKRGDAKWQETPLEKLVNDRWRASFPVTEVGFYEYTLVAWVDRFSTWRQDLKKRADAGQELGVELEVGAAFVREAALAAKAVASDDARVLNSVADSLAGAESSRRSGAGSIERRLADALDPLLPALMERHAPRSFATEYGKTLEVFADRERARFSTWYEMFPRSASSEPGEHGTFKDVEARLPYVAEMGFDILYLPPIHPIGRLFRKGKNNKVSADPGEPGSPWAIGGPEGGHKDIHPELGTLEEFRGLVSAARRHGVEIGLDIAFQCSPDHPYVREHPEWFLERPDGTIQYAENPPKKYQDIYPFHFECEDWKALWVELASVFFHWIDQGVKVFRVDNPHTKPFKFWAWCIGEIRRAHPDVIFLSEAFTRPHPMYKLAKLGFSQSYTYFAWKNTKQELEEWWSETVHGEPREYYRPNLWPNTPDILNAYLQHGGRPAFVTRLVLAATMGASYGIYGPAFELVEHTPREHGSEEYIDSEKYEVRHWDLQRPGSLRHLIGLVNKARKEHPALQSNAHFAFHSTDNDKLLCYSKTTADKDDVIVTVVNLDPYHVQSGWVELNLDVLGFENDRPFQTHDLITGARYLWHGSRNFVMLDPHSAPAHVLFLRRHVRTEQDFDYFA